MIKGGKDSANPDRYSFISGAISDTRLMGVVAMHLAYIDMVLNTAFHQFYYFDYEELGLEHINLLRSDDKDELELAIRQNFAGLGANIVDLTEKESRYMVQWMVAETRRKNQPLPPELDELRYLYEVYTEDVTQKGALAKTGMDKRELDLLNVKMCVPITSDYGTLNYYLMRVFGKDEEGARLLVSGETTAEGHELEDVSPKSHSTFLKNKISLIDGSSQRKIYRCESIIEVDSESAHHLVVSEIEVYKRRVSAVKKISDTKISFFEAGMALGRTEYITVYKPSRNCYPALFVSGFNRFTIGMTKTEHMAGDMYIDFKPDNKHAENKVFLLSDDVRALFFITQSGELVVAANSFFGIIEAEERLFRSELGNQTEAINRYSFAASIIYDFAESGANTFREFIEALDLL